MARRRAAASWRGRPRPGRAGSAPPGRRAVARGGPSGRRCRRRRGRWSSRGGAGGRSWRDRGTAGRRLVCSLKRGRQTDVHGVAREAAAGAGPAVASASFVVVFDTGLTVTVASAVRFGVTSALPVGGLQLGRGERPARVRRSSCCSADEGRRPVSGRHRLFLAGFTLLALASLAGAPAAAPGCCWRPGSPRGWGWCPPAPTSISLITSIFEQGPERDRAVNVYSAMAALGAITGVVLGGVVTQLLNWRWVLVAALPIALPVIALTPTVVGEHRAPGRHGLLDPRGRPYRDARAGVAPPRRVAGRRARVGRAGDPRPARRRRGPARRVRGRRAARAGAAGAAPGPAATAGCRAERRHLLTATTGASTYLLTLYVQRVLGQSPLEAGLSLLPLSVAAAVAATVPGLAGAAPRRAKADNGPRDRRPGRRPAGDGSAVDARPGGGDGPASSGPSARCSPTCPSRSPPPPGGTRPTRASGPAWSSPPRRWAGPSASAS